MKKIKVLHLELDSHMGGIESFLYNLYSEIDRDQIQFDFVTRSDKPAMGEELKSIGATIYKISSYRNPLAYMKDLNGVIQKGYDVVHIHKNSAAIIFPFIVAHKYKSVKVFVHSHNTSPSIGRITKILHELNKRILWRYSDKHFACSEAAGQWLYGEHREFIVLKNGILTEHYRFNQGVRNQKRTELGISDDTFVIGNVGRFTEQKNQKRLVQIFEKILEKNRNTKLLLVGDGKQKQSVEEYCREKQLLDDVIFLGVRNDIAELMMAMDAFVMPSMYEGLPIVAIEAQSTGLPLYLSDTIAKETDITKEVQWFSLQEKDDSIAERIRMEQIAGEKRRDDNSKVANAGFNMKETANYLYREYQGK